jgi:hypothetical protein
MAADILDQDPAAKVAIMYQNDEAAKPATELLEKTLADAGAELVGQETYDITARPWTRRSPAWLSRALTS